MYLNKPIKKKNGMAWWHTLFGVVSRQQYDELLKQVKETVETMQNLQINFQGVLTDVESQHQEEINTLLNEVERLESRFPNIVTALEKYCEEHFNPVSKFAYEAKAYWSNKPMAMYPNEVITPEAFEVERLRKQLDLESIDDFYKKVRKAADWVARNKRWAADKVTSGFIDYYETAAQGIVAEEIDCESHAAIVSSLLPSVGIAFGFAGSTAHAWNVFVYRDELWCAETNSVSQINKARLFRYDKQDKYKIHFIFTKQYTYLVTGGVRFGEVAENE